VVRRGSANVHSSLDYFPNMRFDPSLTFTSTSYANESTLSANIVQANMPGFSVVDHGNGRFNDEHPNCIECEDVRGKMKNVTASNMNL